MDLLDYYQTNLQYIRGLAAEFAAEFPKIASRLSLSEFACQDPYIERLLEGTAFLSAQVEKKLDEGYYGFLESVLNSLTPHALYPIPSGGVLELTLNDNHEKVREGLKLEAGTLFDAAIPSIHTPCRFSSLIPIPLTPFSLTGAEYITRDLSSFGVNNPQGLAALHLTCAAQGGNSLSFPDELLFFINLPEAEASLLQRQIMQDTLGVYVRQGEEAFVPVSGVSFELPMSRGGSLVHDKLKGAPKGLGLLQHFMAYPAFFKFFSIKNMGSLGRTGMANLELLMVFKRREPSLVSPVKVSSLRLNCVPVLNLFTKRSDRIALERAAYEFHILPDRTAMRDYEVLSIHRLEFFNERNETLFFARNFYDEDLMQENSKRNFFSQHRRKTLLDPKAAQRSSYGGTEVFVSFTAQSPNLEKAYQFAADLVCTNRDLPLLLLPNTELSPHTPLLQRGFFITPPTRPGYPLIERGDTSDFAKVSHLVFNLSGMLWQDGTLPLKMFKTLLGTYRLRAEDEMERMIEGLVELESEQKSFRFIKNGMVFFEYGWNIWFTLDELAYAGTGCYMFAAIIGEILKSFSPINTLLEINFYTLQSGHIATWKTLEN